MLAMMNGGSFYSNSQTEVVVDPFTPPSAQSQSKLQGELKRCEQLVQRDYRYAHLVAGAAKMPMTSIWVARNQDELVNDRDLATFKDIAWAEFVKKRFLPTVPAGESVSTAATSMLEIVREMNLQRRRFQIMGLHEQVEANEIQLVMHLCQAGLIRAQANDFKRTALRMRRSQKLHEPFAIAVGACVCASAPMTMGSGVTRYERDLQMEYRKNTIGLLAYALQRNPGAIDEETGLDEDYVARIAKLIVFWQGNGAGRQQVGDGGGDDGDDGKESVKAHLIALTNAVGLAQRDAEKAKSDGVKLEAENKGLLISVDGKISSIRGEMRVAMAQLEGKFQAAIAEMQARTAAQMRDAVALASGSGQRNQTLSGDTLTALTADIEQRLEDKIRRTMDQKMREAEIDLKVRNAVTDANIPVKVAVAVADNLQNQDITGKVRDAVQRENIDHRVDAAIATLKRENAASIQDAIQQQGIDGRVQAAVAVLDIASRIRDVMKELEARQQMHAMATQIASTWRGATILLAKKHLWNIFTASSEQTATRLCVCLD